MLFVESGNNMESIRESYTNAVNELNQELLAMKEVYEQLDAEKQDLINELEKRPVTIAQEPLIETIGTFSSFYIGLSKMNLNFRKSFTESAARSI